MIKAICITFLSCLFFVSLSFSQESTGIGRITGYVRDSETQKPLEAASVTLSPLMDVVYTDVEGAFAFENIDSGDYTITARAKDHKDAEENIKLSAGQTYEIEFQLSLNLVWYKKLLRVFYSRAMIEFYIYIGTFFVAWGIAAILGRLLEAGYTDRSANSAWLVAIILHIIIGMGLIADVLNVSLRSQPWYYATGWASPFLGFFIVDFVLIAFLLKQRNRLYRTA